MKQFARKHLISIAISYVLFLILISAGLSYYTKHIMLQANDLKQQTEIIKQETNNLSQIVRNIDVSIRGYAIMQEDRFLFLPVDEARQINQRNIAAIDSLLQLQGYNNLEMYAAVKQGLHDYIELYQQMIGLIKQNDMAEFRRLLGQDRGKHFWKSYEKFTAALFAHEDKVYQETKEEYEVISRRNNVVQILLLLIGIPTLVFVLRKLNVDKEKRKSLLKNLEVNNQQYLFNPGKGNENQQEAQVLEASIENLKKAADFVNHISQGNYQVEWHGLTEENKSLNEQNLVGKLILMREQMKKVKLEDEKRLWVTEGISRFSEIIRNHQHSLEDLCYQSLVFVIKYMHAQQGSLFVHKTEEGAGEYLELSACYAFDRKKHLHKRVEIGQGILGQTYLEAETVILTDLPQQYTTITSGLGEATPSCLLIVPMKYNDKVQAIIEIASFRKYESHEIAFVEKAGEFVASAIASAQNNTITQSLLTQFKAQTEQMRAQEEEMRQNLEELEATQEEMKRNERAHLQKIQYLQDDLQSQ